MRLPRGVDDGIGGWTALGQFAVFIDINIGERPGVFEGGAGRLTADGRGVILVAV